MSQPPNKIFVLPQDVTPGMSPQDMQSYVQLQNELIESFVGRASSQSERAWLEQELARLNPGADSAYVKQNSAVILNTLDALNKKEERINLLRQKGIKDEARLATELFEKTKHMSREEANDYFNTLAQQINESNQRTFNTFTTYAGLSPDVLANSTSNQYAVLSEVARFNAQAQAENTGLRAVLDESCVSPAEPFGQIKILNSQNQVVDAFSIRYAGGAGTDNQSQIESALEQLRGSYAANQAGKMPFGVRVDLPNGGSQDIYVGIPKYSGATTTDASGRVFFKDRAEFSPYTNYFGYTGNLPTVGDPASQLMTLSMVAAQDVPRNLPQFLKYRAMEIARAISKSPLVTFDYGRYAKIAGSYAYQGAVLTAQGAKFVLESLLKGSLLGLQMISTVALKCGSYAWSKIKEFDYAYAASVAGSCICTCASLVKDACVGLFKTIKDTVNVLRGKEVVEELEPTTDSDFHDDDVVEKKTKKKRRRRRKKKSQQQTEQQSTQLELKEEKEESADHDLFLPIEVQIEVSNSTEPSVGDKILNSLGNFASTLIDVGTKLLPLIPSAIPGLGPVGSVVCGTALEIGSEVIGNKVKERMQQEADKEANKMRETLDPTPTYQKQTSKARSNKATQERREKQRV